MRCEMIPIRVKGMEETASLTLYLLDNSEELYDGLLRPMILICPGGGYEKTSDREGEGLALKFLAMGCHCAVLRYSVAPARYPAAFLQAGAAMKLIRERAGEWYIKKDQVFVQGSSAGGHLAACLGVGFREKSLCEALDAAPEILRPSGMILSYPVITTGEFANWRSFENLLGEKMLHEEAGAQLLRKLSLEYQVTAETPRTFLWHTFEDAMVPVENSLLFVQALRKKKVPVEFHLFEKGSHGLGTATRLTMSRDGRGIQKECAPWMDLVKTWLENGTEI